LAARKSKNKKKDRGEEKIALGREKNDVHIHLYRPQGKEEIKKRNREEGVSADLYQLLARGGEKGEKHQAPAPSYANFCGRGGRGGRRPAVFHIRGLHGGGGKKRGKRAKEPKKGSGVLFLVEEKEKGEEPEKKKKGRPPSLFRLKKGECPFNTVPFEEGETMPEKGPGPRWLDAAWNQRKKKKAKASCRRESNPGRGRKAAGRLGIFGGRGQWRCSSTKEAGEKKNLSPEKGTAGPPCPPGSKKKGRVLGRGRGREGARSLA